MAKAYSIRPSQVLGLQHDEYTAFCFDEACAIIMSRLNQGEHCYFKDDMTEPKIKNDDLITFLKDFEKSE